MRAAFKAVQDGKQVAMLGPDHAAGPAAPLHVLRAVRATSRWSSSRCRRFQTAKETAQVLRGDRRRQRSTSSSAPTGCCSGEVAFKDLGLVVVDEEQRFGVEHKEYLKQMRTAVDVLTMSATPIPRTLEMAVTGIREMSTITTPPEERHPVLTFVGPYDEKQIAAAIRRELLREGQVFYIHNRVESIDRAAARLRELVPEARIATAHGQMNEDALEQVMVDFWEKEFDVLVCTTIVESGLDISNANTLIVERADVFGLSQLHQLRGRVGRGRERAYAYFLYPPEKPLTETAHDRLATIAQNTELGAGMTVAMKDLEIRGAGNLLGGEQSGHIAGVGLRPVRPAGRRGGGRVQGRGGAGAGRGQGRAAGGRAPAARLHPGRAAAAGGLPQDRRDRPRGASSRRSATSWPTATASRRAPVENLLEVARFRVLARRAGLARGRRCRATTCASRPVELRESQAAAAAAALPGHAGQAGGQDPAGAPSDDRADRRSAGRRRRPVDTGPPTSSTP